GRSWEDESAGDTWARVIRRGREGRGCRYDVSGIATYLFWIESSWTEWIDRGGGRRAGRPRAGVACGSRCAGAREWRARPGSSDRGDSAERSGESSPADRRGDGFELVDPALGGVASDGAGAG